MLNPLPKLERLSGSNIDSLPRYKDFDKTPEGDADAWELIEPAFYRLTTDQLDHLCWKQGFNPLDEPDAETYRSIQIERLLDGFRENANLAYDSLYYPVLPNVNISDCALDIYHLPIVLVGLYDGYALVPTEFYLEWSLVEAYLRCGQLPPSAICDLDTYALWEKHPLAVQMLAACQTSMHRTLMRACDIQHRLQRLREELEQQ